MGKALYRTHRSKKLSEIIGQEHITDTLQSAISSGKISHAYLFTGPRGVGKTSIARILAHEINKLPYDEDANHLDIIEIDAASNRRIDEIRDLREKVHIAPTSAAYKVYIIDEVHMLTKEAFNALLKTLEEPPAHVVFILATTEAHKLPETIISRTQRYSFRPVEKQKVIDHLRNIAKEEGISIDDEALAMIADHGEGSFRDSIGLLDQARHISDKIAASDVRQLLGIAPSELIKEMFADLRQANALAVLELLAQLKEQGYLSGQIAKQLLSNIREDSDLRRTPAMLGLAKSLIDIHTSHDIDTALEISLLRHMPIASTTQHVVNAPNKPLPPKAPVTTSKPPEPKPEPKPIANNVHEKTPEADTPGPSEEVVLSEAKASEPIDDDLWQKVLERIKKTNNTLYGVARMAHVTISEDTVELQFAFPFHQKKMSDMQNKQIISDVIQSMTGKGLQVVCTVGKAAPTKKVPAENSVKDSPSEAPPLPDTISNIFGGAEVLES